MRVTLKSLLVGQVVVASAVTGGLGWAAYSGISGMREDAEAIAQSWAPSVDLTRQIDTAASDYRVAQARQVIGSLEDLDQWIASAEEVEARLSRLKSDYEPLITSEEERRLYADFNRRWDEYIGFEDALLAALRAGDRVSAQQIYMDDMRPAFAAATDRLGELAELNKAGMANAMTEAEAVAASSMFWTIVAIIAAMIVAFAALLIVIKGVIAPLRLMTDAMRNVSAGDLKSDVPFATRQDEVGEMAKTLVLFRDGLREAEEQRRAREQERQEAQAQLMAEKARIADEFESRMCALANEFGKASDELSAAATSLAAAAEETSRQAGSVASAASAASSSVQTAAAGTEELSSSIQEISERVSHSAEMATSVAGDAERSNREVTALATAAQQINEVVALIADIADKTNLLALNATIEAARAGAAGAGFAVVASEVKELASQTARATEEIRVKIGEVQSASGSAVSSMTKVGAAIEELRATATAIAGAVEQQRAATSEISESTGRAAHSAGDVSDSVGGLSVAAETTGSASSQLLALSQDLSQRSGSLREEVSRFAKHLRSA